MTQKNEELLLRDLCARLPHGVKVKIKYYDDAWKLLAIYTNGTTYATRDIGYPIETYFEDCKPYLFPLTNLTEEQRNYISKLLIDTRDEFSPYGKINIEGCDNLFISTVKQANSLIKYCITHHFDINGLIDKGLAIDATNLNIY